MNRLHILLALSHLILGAGSLRFYAEPGVSAAVALGLGWFIRGTVPWRTEHVRTKTPAGRLFSDVIQVVLLFRLLDLGLLEFLSRAWDDRLSPRPLACMACLVAYLIVKDWSYFVRLSDEKIDAFYARKI